MKTSVTYGFLIALAGLVLSLLMFFTGFHTDVEKMQSGLGKTIGMVLPLVIGIIGLALAMRDTRAQRAPGSWGYGPAFGAGVMTALFAALFSAVTTYLYVGLINPNFSDIVYQAQVAAMEAKNVPAEQIERAEPMMRKMMSPVMMTVIGTFMGFIWSVILSLLIAIFFRKPATSVASPFAEPPPVA